MATWTKVVTESSNGEITQNAATATTATTASTANAVAADSVGILGLKSSEYARGSILYGDASGDPAVLALGSNNYVLKSDGTDIAWAADTNTGDVNQNAWSTITVPAGTTSQAADTATDTITFTAAGGMTITGAADDSIEFSSANTQLDNAGVIGKVLTGLSSGSGTVVATDTIVAAFGRLEGRVALNDAKATNTDVSVSKDNLESTLALMDTNYTIGSSASIDGTISGDLTVTGDLTVSGETTTIQTATLAVEDKMIKLADVTGTPSKTTADAAGIQVESNAVQEVDWPTLKWNKDKGGGHTDGTGTANGLTGWSVSNMQTSAHVSLPIAVMDFKSTTGAPSNIAGGIGSFSYNSNDSELYIRTV